MDLLLTYCGDRGIIFSKINRNFEVYLCLDSLKSLEINT